MFDFIKIIILLLMGNQEAIHHLSVEQELEKHQSETWNIIRL
jgi:hypothetical protein